MKAKKITGLLLAGGLFLGAAAYGSYAGFSDKIESPANITIAMGNLAIEDMGGEDGMLWEVQRGEGDLDTESYEKDDFNPGDSFANVRPGDEFVRTLELQNTGTLKQRVTTTLNGDLANVVVGTTEDGRDVLFSEVFELTMPDNEEFILMPAKDDEEASVKELKISFKVKEEMGNEFNLEDNIAEFNLDDLLGEDTTFITVNAEQVNLK